MQRVLITEGTLSKKQAGDLRQWWKDNHDWAEKKEDGALLTIPLQNHFVDFYFRHIRV